MPRERVHHGEMFVEDKNVPPTDVTDLHGEPGGVTAHVLRPFIPGEILPKESTVHEEPSLDISWNRDAGWVQVSIEAPTDWWDRFNEARIAEGPDRSHYAAFISGMTRQEINHAIRTLRRARDAAFGADE